MNRSQLIASFRKVQQQTADRPVRRRSSGAAPLVWIMAAAAGSLLWWASRARLTVVVRAQGQVIPASSTQVIQSLEGGIITELTVREGQRVEKGSLLAKLHDALYQSRYLENTVQRQAAETRIVRLLAESRGSRTLEFPPELMELSPAEVEQEKLIFQKRREHEDAKLGAIRRRLAVEKERLRVLSPAYREGTLPEVDRITLEGQIADLEAQLVSMATAFSREAAESYDTERAKLAALNEVIKGDEDRIARCEIRSPVTGTVNSILIRTAGRVVGGGESIMEIVPENDALLIEARVRPQDVAFIHAGMEAQTRFTAFDFASYGGLSGQVETMGVNTVQDNTGQTWYPVIVRTASESLGRDKASGEDLRLRAGMVAEVDILSGSRTVLDYLVKPIQRAGALALRER